MGTVVSLGSINVDRIRRLPSAAIAALEAEYEWFPDRGQTVSVTALPDEFSVDPDDVRHGGKGANQAVAAAHAGADAIMLGRVGPDHDTVGALSGLEAHGVDSSRIGVASAPTGTAYVFVDPDGDNRIVIRPGANDRVDQAYVREQYETILAAECLLLQNEIPLDPIEALLADLAAEPDPPTVIFDPAPAAGAERLLGYDAVNYLTPNEHEYDLLRPHLDEFDGTVVRTHGGADIVVEGDDRFAVAPPEADPVDTTGAGDVLNGFLAARLADGVPLRDALETASAAASRAVQADGARGGIPAIDSIDR